MSNQKVCFKGAEVMDLIQGRQTPAIKAKLALIEASNTAVRLRGMRFHYDMMNKGCLYMQQEKNQDDAPIPDLTPCNIDYEALD